MWSDLPADPHLPQGVTERFHFDPETGIARIIKEQQLDDMLRAIHCLRDTIKRDRSLGSEARHVGSVPLVIAATWSRECGHPIGTAGFAAYAKRKLMSGEWERLRVHGA